MCAFESRRLGIPQDMTQNNDTLLTAFTPLAGTVGIHMFALVSLRAPYETVSVAVPLFSRRSVATNHPQAARYSDGTPALWQSLSINVLTVVSMRADAFSLGHRLARVLPSPVTPVYQHIIRRVSPREDHPRSPPSFSSC